MDNMAYDPYDLLNAKAGRDLFPEDRQEVDDFQDDRFDLPISEAQEETLFYH